METVSDLNIVLFDSHKRHCDLLPMSFTRPLADFRVGILTLRQKWERIMPGRYSYLPEEYLRGKFAMAGTGSSTFIAGWVLADARLAEAVAALGDGEGLAAGGELIAFRGGREAFEAALDNPAAEGVREYDAPLRALEFVYDIFRLNGQAICDDYRLLTAGRESQPLPDSCRLIGSPTLPDGLPAVFIEEGADLEGASFNVKEGPVYIGRRASVMEGAAVRGPFALGDDAKVRMGTKIYGATTVGPWCKVGGEIDNAVIFGYSNKAHDGYLGNAVVGEWCNIGAGVNASNLKNDYSKIRIWNYPRHTFMRTDLQFCGLIMADHSKAGINCMFNTATVVGVGCNIHGSGFPRVFIPSFSEGSPAGGMTDVSLDRFCVIAQRVMARRGIDLTDDDRAIFSRVYQVASSYKK